MKPVICNYGNQIKVYEVRKHAARLREKKQAKKEWWEILKESDHLEDLDIDGRIILR
jgi:hypothetical protein